MSRHNFCFGEYTETQAAFPPTPSLVELKVRDNQLTQDGEVLFRWRAEEEHSRYSKISEQRACRWDTVCLAPPTGQVSRTFKKSRLTALRLSPTSGWGDPGQGTHMIFL